MNQGWRTLALAGGLTLSAGCAGARPQPHLSTRSADREAVRFAPALAARSRGGVPSPPPASQLPLRDEVETVAFEKNQPTVAPEAPVEAPVLDAPEKPATNGSPQTISLSTLEAWALEHNPAIRQASASALKSMGFRNQVSRTPNPTIGYMGQQLGDDGTDQHLAFLSQDIVLGGKLELNDQVLGHGVQSQLWEVEAQRFRVLTDVRLRYYDALAAQQRLGAANEFHKVLAKGVSVAEARKQALEGTQPEVLLARVQLNQLELTQRRSEIAFNAAWNELAATIGLRQLPVAPLEITAGPPTSDRDWNVVYEDLIARSPEIRAASSRVCRAAANVQRQEAQPIPNLELQVAVGHDQATEVQFGQVQAGLPIPVFNKNRGNIDAAQAEYCRALQEVERLKMSIRARLARAAQDFDAARAMVEQYEEKILPQAKESQDLSEQAYAAGEFGFLEVLTSRRVYFEATLELINARRDLAQAAATIEGLLLTGGLDQTVDTPDDDSLRGQALSGQ